MKNSTASKDENSLVWDLPTRLFHWMLVATIATAWLTTTTLYYETHLFSGYLLTMLLLFRLVWGVIGGTCSRFKHFAHPWSAVRQHLTALLQGESTPHRGHNPAGGWMIFLLLGTLLCLTISGLLTLGGEEQSGPLNGWISIENGAQMHQIHNGIAWFLLLLIPIHLLGVAVERWISRRNLIQAMITGSYSHIRPTTQGRKSRLGSLVSGLLLSTPAFALWFSSIEPDFTVPLYPSDWSRASGYTLWSEACSECHTLHHPSLLPARSWQKMMDQQQQHFEEDLALDIESRQQITRFLMTYSAESANSEASWKISNSIDQSSAPLQITQTPYWIEKHSALADSLWELPSVGGKIHCDGCHQDAAAGTYRDRAVALPGV